MYARVCVENCSLLRYIDFDSNATRIGFLEGQAVNGWRLTRNDEGKFWVKLGRIFQNDLKLWISYNIVIFGQNNYFQKT